MRMTELVLKVVTGEELGAGRRVFLGLFHPNTVGARDRCRDRRGHCWLISILLF